MPDKWDKLDKDVIPELRTIATWVNTPLWAEFLQYMEETYQIRTTIEYSGCGMAPGWNVKLRKSGKGLCTLYPQDGWFIALVVIGPKEKDEMELMLPTLGEYTQSLYANTKEGMGQRWLMFQVRDATILDDVKQCIGIRAHKVSFFA